MDFYTQQSNRHWQSTLLLIAFVFVLLLMGGLIHIVMSALSQAMGQGGSFAQPSKPAIAMIVLVWLTMLAGSLFRLMDVKAGGAVLARRFGAVHASDRSRHEKEARLLNVVAEMSIASSTAQPDVFVLRQERSINAFVLGNSQSRPVIVLTDGALEVFDREQLQAVVAHEFAHITNGDLAMNMRLLVVMGGLMAIDEVGRLLIGKADNETFHPGMLVGSLLCALGSVGVVSGKLICAAFSRQREYLADATAVQFTRNPYALAEALDVAQEHAGDPALHGLHAGELVHLCFHAGKVREWMNRLSWARRVFSSHPDVLLRIKAVEPHFYVKQRKALRGSSDVVTQRTVNGQIPFIGNAQSLSVVDINAESVLTGPSVSTVVDTESSLVPSDRIILLLQDGSLCIAALFSLFAHEGENLRPEYLNALTVSTNKKLCADVKKVIQLVPGELARDQLGVIAHASEMLNKQLSLEQRQKIVLKLEHLLSVNADYQLMDYARIQLIRRKLQVEFPVVSVIVSETRSHANGRKAKNFDAMGREFALLLSLMVESSGASPADVDEHFKRVLKCYTQENLPRRTAKETGIVDELEAAFQTLYIQPYSIRHAFVQHCIEIMQHDGYIVPSERALLDLFAASLGCDELIAA